MAAARPTAVNLAWGAERMRRLAIDNADLSVPEMRELILTEALAMVEEDETRNRELGKHGAELLGEDSKVLTHCNAGSLATAYFGTALGVIFTAHEQGKIAHVWVDETRPVLQGARLTAWELMMAGVPCALITDSMAAWVMQQGAVDAVIVGADRIAANGDVANKIGTYGLAVVAHEHGIPFYVAAPSSTVDLMTGTGADIPIEQRNPDEVTGVTWASVFEAEDPAVTRAFDALTEEGPYEIPLGRGHKMMVARKGAAYQLDGWARIAPENVPVYNPAFDVTPAEVHHGHHHRARRRAPRLRDVTGADLHGLGGYARTHRARVGLRDVGRRAREHDPDVRRDRRDRMAAPRDRATSPEGRPADQRDHHLRRAARLRLPRGARGAPRPRACDRRRGRMGRLRGGAARLVARRPRAQACPRASRGASSWQPRSATPATSATRSRRRSSAVRRCRGAIFYDVFGTVGALVLVGLALAEHYGGGAEKRKHPVREVLGFPAVIALAVGLATRPIPFSDAVSSGLGILASLVVPLIMISVGLSLRAGVMRRWALPLTALAVVKLLLRPRHRAGHRRRGAGR